MSKAFIRFVDVTIPYASQITNCELILTAFTDSDDVGVNVTCYFVDEDDPDAPVNTSELDALSLTSGVDWPNLSDWKDNLTYKSIDLSSILQTIVDRDGWSSGQAVILILNDNSSPSQKTKEFSAYDWRGGVEKASLRVSWVPGEAAASRKIYSLVNFAYRLDMQIDSNDYKHIALVEVYQQAGSSLKLTYLYGTEGSYASETVVAADSPSIWWQAEIRLRVDSNNYPHILLSRNVTGVGWRQDYVYKDGTGWHLENLGTTINVNWVRQEHALVLDDSDNPHIFLFDNVANEVQHWYKSGGWVKEAVYSGSTYKRMLIGCMKGGYLYLKTGNAGDYGANIWKKDGTWSLEATIANSEYVSYTGLMLMLKADSSNRLYMISVQSNSGPNGIVYFHDNKQGITSWRKVEVKSYVGGEDDEIDIENMSADVKPNGEVGFIWSYDLNGDIMTIEYATGTPPNLGEPITIYEGRAEYIALRYDSSGVAHVAFQNDALDAIEMMVGV